MNSLQYKLTAACIMTMTFLLGPTACATSQQVTGESTSELPRGIRWIRSHPVTIYAMCVIDTPLDTDQYQQAGLGPVMIWKTKKNIVEPVVKAGLPWHTHIRVGRQGRPRLNEELKEKWRQFFAQNPGAQGILVNDEVKGEEALRITREGMDWLRDEYPHLLVYSNANNLTPGGRDKPFLQNWERALKPDVMMVTLYPFLKTGQTEENYFFNLEIIRQVSLEAGIPYWSWVQSFSGRVGYPERLPSESDLRMQLFASLTYGFTGFGFHIYEVGDHPIIRHALISKGKPSRLYPHAEKANAEVSRLGQSLRFLRSTSVQYLPAPGATLPTGVTAWAAENTSQKIQQVGGITSSDGLLGQFTDDHGGEYFMLTNLAQGPEMSAKEGEVTFHVKFADGAAALYRLNRYTGKSEKVMNAGGRELAVTLPGGTGDLFKWGDAAFAGL